MLGTKLVFLLYGCDKSLPDPNSIIESGYLVDRNDFFIDDTSVFDVSFLCLLEKNVVSDD